MKKSILLICILPLLSCVIKKELATAKMKNEELTTTVQELKTKQTKLEMQNKILYEHTQKCRKDAARLIKENQRLKTSYRNTPYSENEAIFNIVEKMPEFPGGKEKLYQFLAKNIKYPSRAKENSVRGKVYVEFVVEKDGSLTNIKVIRGIGSGCDYQVIRVVKMMPKWVAGEQREKKVRVKYVSPVMFSLR